MNDGSRIVRQRLEHELPKLGGNLRMKAGWCGAENEIILGLATALEPGQNKVFIKLPPCLPKEK